MHSIYYYFNFSVVLTILIADITKSHNWMRTFYILHTKLHLISPIQHLQRIILLQIVHITIRLHTTLVSAGWLNQYRSRVVMLMFSCNVPRLKTTGSTTAWQKPPSAVFEWSNTTDNKNLNKPWLSCWWVHTVTVSPVLPLPVFMLTVAHYYS